MRALSDVRDTADCPDSTKDSVVCATDVDRGEVCDDDLDTDEYASASDTGDGPSDQHHCVVVRRSRDSTSDHEDKQRGDRNNPAAEYRRQTADEGDEGGRSQCTVSAISAGLLLYCQTVLGGADP